LAHVLVGEPVPTSPEHALQENPLARPAALVTGASYGVGAATALALARAGHDVAITATRSDNLRDTVASLADTGARVVPLALDLRAPDDIVRAFGEALAALGRLDLLVNNAAVNLRRRALDVTLEEWDTVIGTNTRGTFLLSQQAARHWIGQKQPGCIVNVASAHAFVGAAERSTYGISKAAIVHMTKMLAVEWGDHGIRVNAVAPGRMQTDSPSRAAKGSDPAYMAAMLARIPLHRLATPDEVASAIAWLASPQAAAVTGHTIVLDGGLTAA
jgi:NAD(P)-dependent dehydrogenase (short-subunit alcohol dehydrogenase family)